MQTESYESRKKYVESVKNSFPISTQNQRPETEDTEIHPRNFLGLRFVLALLLFLGFLLIRQTDVSWHSWNAEKITQQIEKNIDFSKLLERFQL